MTKILFAALVLSFATSPAFAADIFKKKFDDTDDEKLEAQVLETYNAALQSDKPNALKALVAKLGKGGDNSVDVPSEGDILDIDFIKGSATSYSYEYLVGIPVSTPGTGNARKSEAFLRVHAAVQMGGDAPATMITIKSIVKLVDVK